MGTAAAMLFAFSLVTAAYSFMLTQYELSDSSIAGRVVESTKWAVEADLYGCQGGGAFGSAQGIGMNLFKSVSGNKSKIDSYPLGFMDVTVQLVTNYAPGVKLEYLSGTTSLNWTYCDADGDTITGYTLYWSTGSSGMGTSTSYSSPAAETYWVKATDSQGNEGYSNVVIV